MEWLTLIPSVIALGVSAYSILQNRKVKQGYLEVLETTRDAAWREGFRSGMRRARP